MQHLTGVEVEQAIVDNIHGLDGYGLADLYDLLFPNVHAIFNLETKMIDILEPGDKGYDDDELFGHAPNRPSEKGNS